MAAVELLLREFDDRNVMAELVAMDVVRGSA